MYQVGLMLQVCLINDPRVGHDYYKTLYKTLYLGNRIEGHPVRYIDVPIDVPIYVLKKAAAETIKSKEVTTRWRCNNTEVYNDVCTVCVCVGCLVWM